MSNEPQVPFPVPWVGRDLPPPSAAREVIAPLVLSQLCAWMLWLGLDVSDRHTVVDGLLGFALSVLGLGGQCLFAGLLERSWAELSYRPFLAWYPRWSRWATATFVHMLPWIALTAAFAAPAAAKLTTDGWPRFLLCSLPTTVAGLMFAFGRALGSLHTLSPTPPPESVALPVLPEVSTVGSGTTVLHLSDLHVTAGRRTLEGAPSPDRRLIKLFEVYAPRIAASDVVLVTGDMTDAGLAAEWAAFFEIVARTPGLIDRMVLVPGNHDISVAGARKRDGDQDWLGRSLRLIRMMGAIRRTQAERSYCMAAEGPVPVAQLLDAEAFELQRFVDAPPERVYREIRTAHGGYREELTSEVEKQRFGYPARVWESLFPMAVKTTPGDYIFVFDSNRPASNVLANALGEIAAAQLERADRLSQALAARICVVALHHQIHLPSQTSNLVDLVIDHGLTLVNAGDVFAWLAKHTVAVFHGHRHFAHERLYRDGPVTIISARSTTLGDPRQQLAPGARRFRVDAGRITGCDTLELSLPPPLP